MSHQYGTSLGISVSIIHKYSFLAVVYYCGLVIRHVKSEQNLRKNRCINIYLNLYKRNVKTAERISCSIIL